MKLKYTTTNRRIRSLYDEWERGVLILDPDFQREYVWTTVYKKGLIESLLNGYPIPQIFLRQQLNEEDLKKEKLQVVDGQQRLTTIFNFINNKFPVDGELDTDDLSKVSNEMFFKDLTKQQQKNIYNYQFSVVELEVDDDEIRLIFSKMNNNVMKLNKQEIRNAQYPGVFSDIINTISKDQEIVKLLIKNKVINNGDIKRQKVQETLSISYLFMEKLEPMDITPNFLDDIYQKKNNEDLDDEIESLKLKVYIMKALICIEALDDIGLRGKYYFQLFALLVNKKGFRKKEEIINYGKSLKAAIQKIKTNKDKWEEFQPTHTRKAISFRKTNQILNEFLESKEITDVL